jgi:hypothetical protein
LRILFLLAHEALLERKRKNVNGAVSTVIAGF